METHCNQKYSFYVSQPLDCEMQRTNVSGTLPFGISSAHVFDNLPMGLTYRNSSAITASPTMTGHMATGWGCMKLLTKTGAGSTDITTLSGKTAFSF